ncbi:FliI/YscN family ATPase [Phycisphaera mikurensis]|uniref:Flagellum-specific ATP synthase FliI n=1 Tax=Phycisphaera mikurensis (strain NBRC 102666 / KCTC 22515 / FYK2301M01) TaxID=1142394 RepID=I0IGE2_PHYMF|nr:FliI/YscN family ATPase [Phycisphaera mikurensis]MBB6440292.1 flagellum-specific ATP synthase [Phycisphaera mikurensis]BAM04330.1 flagellum-specific ATP synthase FliI [Phycisphaera mikurensis NBRC 102666]
MRTAERLAAIEAAVAPRLSGRVSEIRGMSVCVEGLAVAIGTTVRLVRGGGRPAVPAEAVGFEGGRAVLLPLAEADGLRPGDPAHAEQASAAATFPVGGCLLGRVLDALGRPIDGRGPLRGWTPRALEAPPPGACGRALIGQPLATGVRAIDGLMPLGRGQRMGIFAPPGVGKSTLLAACARGCAADVVVVGLVGERGREVNEFVERTLGPEGLARSVVVVATGDEPAPMRLRAARAATCVAEHFRDGGADVLLLMDSVTRFAQAQRQVGLAAGEPPATRGFPPSVFAALPRLLERAGPGAGGVGSITALYAVLVEGEEAGADPVSEACRGVLDGHLMLDRKLAERGHHPAIDCCASISRVAPHVVDAEHDAARLEVLRLLAAHRDVEDLVAVGAYAAGSRPEADRAIAMKPAMDTFLRQGLASRSASPAFAATRAQLLALAAMADEPAASPRR